MRFSTCWLTPQTPTTVGMGQAKASSHIQVARVDVKTQVPEQSSQLPRHISKELH